MSVPYILALVSRILCVNRVMIASTGEEFGWNGAGKNMPTKPPIKMFSPVNSEANGAPHTTATIRTGIGAVRTENDRQDFA